MNSATVFMAMRFLSRFGLFGTVVGLLAVLGCGAPEARFTLNRVHARAKEKELDAKLSGTQLRNAASVLDAFFGTPDRPQLPPLDTVDVSKLISGQRLVLASGPVGRGLGGEAHGLYREHCVHCHGITGDGAGPTAAFLNPYPRDYRRGTFKFKSTPGVTPPTHDDLKRVLYDGIPGTAMPSFKVLDDAQLDALVHYVKYLSIRGQAERALIELAAGELEEKQLLVDIDSSAADEHLKLVKETIEPLVESWLTAETVPVPAPPEDWKSPESIAQGRKLFFTTLTNCSKCHGDSALGDGQTTDYDEWTKDWTIKINLDPKKDQRALGGFLNAGALQPRNIRPRNLRMGVYRGGRRPIDLYWRIKNGIAGTPMPEASKQMTDDDIWHLIAYVRTLPYESISQPEHIPNYQRDLP